MPRYVEKRLGGNDVAVGIAVGALAVGAILLRPLAGRMGDRFGRRVLMIGGATRRRHDWRSRPAWWSRCRISSPRGVVMGLGEAGFFVGGTTMATDLAPVARRGEAVSYWSVAVWGGLALGPVLGEIVLDHSHYDRVWLVAGALALVGRGDRARSPPRPAGAARLCAAALINPAAVKPGVLLALTLLGIVGFSIFLPLYAPEAGVGDVGLLFLLYGVVVLAVRIFGARLPDRLGPLRAGSIAMGATTLGLVVVAAWQTTAGLVVGAVVIAVGSSFLYPVVAAARVAGRAGRASGVRWWARSARSSTSRAAPPAWCWAGSPPCRAIRGAFAAGAVLAFIGLLLLRMGFGRASGPAAGVAVEPAVPTTDSVATARSSPTRCRDPPARDDRRAAAMTALLVTNDFPPKIGGIQSYLYELWRRLPPGDATVFTTPLPRRPRSGTPPQPFRVVRAAERQFFPTPGLARRIDALAREVGADLILLDPWLPLGRLGPRLRSAPYGVIVHGAEVTVPGRLPGTRQLGGRVLRGAAVVIVAAGHYPAREAARAAGGALPGVIVPPGSTSIASAPSTPPTVPRPGGRSGSIPTDRWCSASAGSCPARVSTCSSTPSPGSPTCSSRSRAPGATARRLEARVRGGGLGSRARFLGRVPDDDSFPRLYAAADVFAVPCRDRWAGPRGRGIRDRVPRSGRRRVCPRWPAAAAGSHEAVVDGETGFVVDGRAADVQGALAAILDDDALPARMGARGAGAGRRRVLLRTPRRPARADRRRRPRRHRPAGVNAGTLARVTEPDRARAARSPDRDLRLGRERALRGHCDPGRARSRRGDRRRHRCRAGPVPRSRSGTFVYAFAVGLARSAPR